MPGKSFGPKSKGSERGSFGAGKKPMTKTGKSVPFDGPRKPPVLSNPKPPSSGNTGNKGPRGNTGNKKPQVGKPGYKR